MDIISLDKNRINEVKPLWEELNAIHLKRSLNFKDHFRSFTFEKRAQALLKREHLKIFVAVEENKFHGYCISTVEMDKGEIDSIYICPEYQGQGIGERLIGEAMDWFDTFGCRELNICVAEGNESVIDFYEKFGFKKRFVVMQKRKT